MDVPPNIPYVSSLFITCSLFLSDFINHLSIISWNTCIKSSSVTQLIWIPPSVVSAFCTKGNHLCTFVCNPFIQYPKLNSHSFLSSTQKLLLLVSRSLFQASVLTYTAPHLRCLLHGATIAFEVCLHNRFLSTL